MNLSKGNAQTCVYVVDENYRINSYNDVFNVKFPKIKKGDICYEQIRNDKHPCKDCPLNREEYGSGILFHEGLNGWVEINSGQLEWPDKGMCNLILFREIYKSEEYPNHNLEKLAAELRCKEGFQYVLRNELTGLYRREVFFEKVEILLKDKGEEEYCLIAIDIEHFKLFNEWYGKEAGDRFLIEIGEKLKAAETGGNGIAGYMGADDFCILLPNNLVLLENLKAQILLYVKQYGGNTGFLPAFGVYLIDDTQLLVSMMYDRACIALSSVKGSYAHRICWYDAKMMKKLEDNYQLLREVQRALEKEEFTYYIQPKCNLVTGRIVGAESLVRWMHPKRGMISPAEFILILEENGFITELDMYIWEQVCRDIQKWVRQGRKVVPISVNVSRVDIFVVNVSEVFRNLVEKYEIDPRLVEIEITESAYVEEYQIISQAVEQLRENGFTVLMDDFGSGYSSLNMLKDVNVDVLKIDMKFLDMTKDHTERGLGILGAIISMARLMEMRLIAEGVETQQQRKALLDRGCLYAQGYYFYPPISIEEFERLSADESHLDTRGIRTENVEHVSMKELLGGDVLSEAMMNNLLGGVAFYDVSEQNIRLLRVNEQYYKMMGSNPEDVLEHKNDIIEHIYPEDRELFLNIFYEAYENRNSGAEGEFRRYKENGSLIWICLRAFFFKEQDGHRIYYGSVTDVTDQRDMRFRQQGLNADHTEPEIDQDEQLKRLGLRMESILRQAGLSSWEWDMKCRTLTVDYGCKGEKVIAEFPECIEELSSIGAKFKNEYFEYLKAMKTGKLAEGTRFDLPVMKKDGQLTWYQIACEIMRDGRGNAYKAVGYYVDITEQKTQDLKSKESLKALETDALTGLYNRQTAVPKMRDYLQSIRAEETAAMLMFDMDNFKLANDVFGHIYGDTIITENAQKLRKFFREEDIMCRIGGDEFLVLCKNIGEEDIEKKLEAIIKEMVITCCKGEQEILFSMSAGYALTPNMGTDFEELYEKADIALFSAKMGGKGGFRKYDVSMKTIRYELADCIEEGKSGHEDN